MMRSRDTARLTRLTFGVLLSIVFGCALCSGASAESKNRPRAVPTFECIGLYWKAPRGTCGVSYRQTGSTQWREALPLWFDEVDREHRGSIVGLQDGVAYEIRLTPGEAAPVFLSTSTRDNNLPIARTVKLPTGTRSEPLIINESDGGSEHGYVLFEAAEHGKTIDVAGRHETCVEIKADYVIVRGVTCVNGARHGIRIGKNHHVVVEDCDVSGWGRHCIDGYGERDHGIYSAEGSHHLLIQRCKVHDPRHGSGSWARRNPAHVKHHPRANPFHTFGPNAIGLMPGPGGNVIRWNDVYSSPGKYFEDGIGVPMNAHPIGFPGPDSDIYQNRVRNCHDEAIEADGCDRNVRIWGNYFSDVFKGVSVAPAREGPVYVFRNVLGLCRKEEGQDGMGFLGNGNTTERSGRVFVFHNTMLTAGPEKPLTALWGGYRFGGRNVVSRNNIWHCIATPYASTAFPVHPSNTFDYDMTNIPHDNLLRPPPADAPKRPVTLGLDLLKRWPRGKQHFPEGAQKHGVTAEAHYRDGHGWDDGKGLGWYQLSANSPGVDRGARLPNFNDGFAGEGPDIGAHERGDPRMKFGPEAAVQIEPLNR